MQVDRAFVVLPYAPCAKGPAALLGGLFERPPFSLYLKVFVAKLNFFGIIQQTPIRSKILPITKLYPPMSEQPLDIQPLIKAAEAAYQHAVAPSSGFRVGAALQTDHGAILTGCNIESPVYLGICAERVALFKALSEGFRKFLALAIVCEEGVHCPPCGTCRQLLWEFAPGLQIILVDKCGTIQLHVIEDLLPKVFERGDRKPFKNNDLM